MLLRSRKAKDWNLIIMHPNNRRIIQICVDCGLLLLVGLIPLITKCGAFTPYHRGFFCDDETIQHPFHPSTVSSAAMAAVGSLLPLIVMIIVEVILFRQGHSTGYEPLTVGKVTFNACVVTIVARYGVFLFGLGCTQTFTDLTKYTIGRLRPHFIDVCRPNYTLFNCSQGYIEADVCTGDPSRIREGRLSFLSGHTSIACYSSLYVALYLQARMIWEFSRLLKHILQIIVVLMGWLTALSRISDYKHHPEDVLMGAVLGISTCLVVILFLSDLPPPPLTRAVQFPHRRMSRHSVQSEPRRDVEMAQTQYKTFSADRVP